MRKFRVNLPDRCYHLISRVAHRAFFLDDEERRDHPNSPRQKYALTKAGSEVQTIDRAVSRFLAARTREEGDSSPKDNIKELLRKYQTTLVNLIFGNISNIGKSNS